MTRRAATSKHERAGVPFAAFLRRIARSRLHAMMAHEEGTRAGDPEAVHDLRVATRRLRSALRLARGLSSRRKPLERQERVLKTLADALGQVRDIDVLLARLKKDGAEAPPGDLPHLDRLIASLEGRRAAGLERMDASVADFGRPRTIARFESLFNSLRAGRSGSKPGPGSGSHGGVTPEIPTLDAARAILPVLLDEVIALEPAVSDPSAVGEHHRLRIAVKRLRYAMETFGPFLSSKLSDRTELLRRIQDLLGRVHDDDVFVPILERYLADRRVEADQRLRKAVFTSTETGPSLNDVRRAVRTSVGGEEREAILRLVARMRAQRRADFAEFQQLWMELERHGVGAGLRSVLEVRGAADGTKSWTSLPEPAE